ncbi:unnamed protein product [Coregonus sp. 'balchen']|nr:unnamed protein product [Coregonus sp. 'balchen']
MLRPAVSHHPCKYNIIQSLQLDSLHSKLSHLHIYHIKSHMNPMRRLTKRQAFCQEYSIGIQQRKTPLINQLKFSSTIQSQRRNLHAPKSGPSNTVANTLWRYGRVYVPGRDRMVPAMACTQGKWWPADDGECGYFVYSDHEYIYALLTDAACTMVYACTPEGEKGNQIMNLNLERFSQMFESSFLARKEQAVDFSLYRLNKVMMDPRQPNYAYQDPYTEVIDISCSNRDQTGPYWNNQEMKSLLSHKVAISHNITRTADSSQPRLNNFYQPCQRRCSSFGFRVRHVDDTPEKECRQRVTPGEEIPNRQVKKSSSFISSMVGKNPESDLNKGRAGLASRANGEQRKTPGTRATLVDLQAKSILSSGFQSLKIIKEDLPATTALPQSAVQQTQRPAASNPSRILPLPPTSGQSGQSPAQSPTVTRSGQYGQPPAQSQTVTQKPRLAR